MYFHGFFYNIIMQPSTYLLIIYYSLTYITANTPEISISKYSTYSFHKF